MRFASLILLSLLCGCMHLTPAQQKLSDECWPYHKVVIAHSLGEVDMAPMFFATVDSSIDKCAVAASLLKQRDTAK